MALILWRKNRNFNRAITKIVWGEWRKICRGWQIFVGARAFFSCFLTPAEDIALVALPDDIVTRVLDDFGEDDGILVLRVLQCLHVEDVEPPVNDRILRCLVGAAKGSLKRFTQLLGMSRVDWRDVVVAAEGWGCNAHLMAHPFPLQLDEFRCREWVVGQRIRLPWREGEDESWEIEASDIREFDLRQIRLEDSGENEVFSGTKVYRAIVRVLCVRGHPISSSPAFEIWLGIWYAVDVRLDTFTLRRVQYDPKEIKPRGKWDQ
jgi:hypothetical protein